MLKHETSRHSLFFFFWEGGGGHSSHKANKQSLLLADGLHCDQQAIPALFYSSFAHKLWNRYRLPGEPEKSSNF